MLNVSFSKACSKGSIVIIIIFWIILTLYDFISANSYFSKASGPMLLYIHNDHPEHSLSEKKKFNIWLRKQAFLRNNIKQVCKKYGSSLRKSVALKEFIYDAEHQLVFCRNAKVGTTTWLASFLLISSKFKHLFNSDKVNTSKKLHMLVPKLFPVKKITRSRLFENSISFSAVRHPFERFVSAYQDKLIDNGNSSYKKITNVLNKRYGNVTFSNYVKLFLEISHKGCRQLNNCSIDRHFRPFISRCGYCDVPYKVISKSENFSEDLKYLGHLSNVTFPNNEFHVSSGGNTRNLAQKYFSELDLKTVQELYKVYQVDFEMFGYSPDIYFNFARSH